MAIEDVAAQAGINLSKPAAPAPAAPAAPSAPAPRDIFNPTTWGLPLPTAPAAPAYNPNQPLIPPGTTLQSPTLTAFKATTADASRANAITSTQQSPASSIVSTSAPVIPDENKTKATVTGLNQPDNRTYVGVDGNTYYANQYGPDGRPLMAGGPDNGVSAAKSASDAYIQSLSDYQAQLEARRQEQIKQINDSFAQTKTDTINTQKNETGTETATLARIGGYLGNSASATGAMLNLAQTHQADLLKLESKRQEAVQAANQAVDDKEFELAKTKAEEAKNIEKTINDRKQQFFTDSISLQNSQREQQTADANMYQDQLKALSTAGPDSIDPKIASTIDAFYGTPGFTKSYVSAAYQGAQAKSQTDIANARKATLDLLKDIPAGKTVTFPDGTTYTGVGQAGDISTFQQTDNDGNTRIFAYNKLTGSVSQMNLGAVGKTSSGGTNPVVKDNVTAKFQSALESAKLKDGTYNPDIYLAIRQELKANSQYPALVADMDKLFLNPKNSYFSDTAIEKLRKAGIYYGDILTGGGGDSSSSSDSGQPIEGNQP